MGRVIGRVGCKGNCMQVDGSSAHYCRCMAYGSMLSVQYDFMGLLDNYTVQLQGLTYKTPNRTPIT